jgi:hypothetical protein
MNDLRFKFYQKAIKELKKSMNHFIQISNKLLSVLPSTQEPKITKN